MAAVFKCNAGSVNRDSLKIELKNSTIDSVKIEILEQLAITGEYDDRNEAISYYQQLLDYNIPLLRRGEIFNRIGYFNWQLGELEASIKDYKRALKVFETLKDTAFIGRIYNNMAASYWALGNNTEALQYYQTALVYRKQVNDDIGVSRVLNNLGKLYQDLGLYDEAFKMHREALIYSQKIEDANAIAYCYSNLGNCYEYTNDFDTALKNYKKGYGILKANYKEHRNDSYFSTFIGGVYLQLNQPDSALFYNRSAIKYAHRISNKVRIAFSENRLGINYLAINELDSARLYLNSSYATCKANGYSTTLKKNLFALAELAEKEGKINLAYDYFKQASVLNDSLYNAELVSKIADIQVKYANDQQEQENVLLRANNEIQEVTIRQQKTITGLLVLCVLFVLVVLVFISISLISNKKLNRELEDSERNLMKANADKDKFFTIIAHDLRTPFNGLLGITELLQAEHDKLSKPELKEITTLLRKSSLNVYSLLDGLLQWAQTQIGTMEYSFKSFDFSRNSANIAEVLGPIATTKKIAIKNEVAEGAFVLADEKSTLTVLRNLVSNAIKFTHAGGTIVISAQKNEHEFIVSVRDNGVGMTPQKIERLFLISEKVTQPGTNDELGTGLGLILCKEFIERNSGRIWVESEIGKGSTFFFTLPISEHS